MNTEYKWAVNPIKLDQAKQAVLRSGKSLSDEAVKEEYVKRGGLTVEQKVEVDKIVRPRTTSNRGRVSTKHDTKQNG